MATAGAHTPPGAACSSQLAGLGFRGGGRLDLCGRELHSPHVHSSLLTAAVQSQAQFFAAPGTGCGGGGGLGNGSTLLCGPGMSPPPQDPSQQCQGASVLPPPHLQLLMDQKVWQLQAGAVKSLGLGWQSVQRHEVPQLQRPILPHPQDLSHQAWGSTQHGNSISLPPMQPCKEEREPFLFLLYDSPRVGMDLCLSRTDKHQTRLACHPGRGPLDAKGLQPNLSSEGIWCRHSIECCNLNHFSLILDPSRSICGWDPPFLNYV